MFRYTDRTVLVCNRATPSPIERRSKRSPPSLRHLDMSMQLTDKVIIITGGCQGLGRSMAEYLAGKGAKLALVDLNQEKLDQAVAACADRKSVV